MRVFWLLSSHSGDLVTIILTSLEFVDSNRDDTNGDHTEANNLNSSDGDIEQSEVDQEGKHK